MLFRLTFTSQYRGSPIDFFEHIHARARVYTNYKRTPCQCEETEGSGKQKIIILFSTRGKKELFHTTAFPYRVGGDNRFNIARSCGGYTILEDFTRVKTSNCSQNVVPSYAYKRVRLPENKYYTQIIIAQREKMKRYEFIPANRQNVVQSNGTLYKK